jgi:hypothetical protein
MVRRDKTDFENIITGIIILIILLSSLKVTKLPQGAKSLGTSNIENIGLPQNAVEKLRNLLKP